MAATVWVPHGARGDRGHLRSWSPVDRGGSQDLRSVSVDFPRPRDLSSNCLCSHCPLVLARYGPLPVPQALAPQGPPSWLPSESLTTAQLLLPCYSGVVCLPWHCFLCPLEGQPREDEPGTCQCTSEHRGTTGTPQATSWCRQVEMRLQLWVQGRWPRAAGKGVLQGVFQGGEVGGSAGL